MKAAAVLVATSLAVANATISVPGINYNPRVGPNWGPDATNCKSSAQIDKDFAILAKITKGVRIYSLTDCNAGELVIGAAKKAGLTVWLGLWVGPEPTIFAAEKAKLSSLISSGLVDSTVVGVHVGSEAVYRKDVTPEKAISNFKEIKAVLTTAKINLPVTIADIGDTWIANPSMVEAVDVVSANQFPFWENKNANDAAAWFYMRMEPLIASATKYKKKILISETGWATGGSAVNTGPTTPAQAAKYFNDFSILAKQMDWDYYYFSSFDMAFNANASITDNVEEHFGLFYANGTMKPCYAELTVSGATTVVTKAPSQLSNVTMTPVPNTIPKNNNDGMGPKTNNSTKPTGATSSPGANASPSAGSNSTGSGKSSTKSAATGAALTSLVTMAIASVIMMAM
ncbi:hypothetical protein SPRG_09569 [Saprolegnia parasitica CBS 223.65]|uniref:glucan endo-1,3-beta-D-glucosidase n=2 Tax=Saprolegnia parasitica (strain CBS 223.65) TaxID=695850 RepID=A0A067C6Y1_SAPPC|nr:hypothetical protein SPRG_09569 [Saprolegnia parasitica CBS 223.65]KDO24925.1 hypothetical protein SPRG_09569 [Saprolegnia parasitica CBS 223.65]|eukprot:XP_012204385.1 hypothetical protein SPRG_09569 [Saprolegnia parasitica CBS 223.65]